ncbi:MAG: hypothetical protein V4702_03840 [Patescibacteria group bacterium]
MAEILLPTTEVQHIDRTDGHPSFDVKQYVFNDGNTQVRVIEIGGNLSGVSVDGEVLDDPEAERQRNSARGFVVDALVNHVLQNTPDLLEPVLDALIDSSV